MKLSKVLLSSAVLAVAALGFVGCGGGDDTENAIKGSGSNYRIDYTNDAADTYRAYKETTLKHEGGVCKITIKDLKSGEASSSANARGGVMGFIWDKKDSANVKDAVDFYLAGARYNGKSIDAYISKLTNITDIQASNFGAEVGATGNNPTEKKYLPTNSNDFASISGFDLVDADEDGEVDDMVVVFYVKAEEDGSYTVYILPESALDEKGAVLDAAISASTVNKFTIPASDTGYEKVTQNKLGVYANVYKNGATLTGTWEFTDVKGNALVPVEE